MPFKGDGPIPEEKETVGQVKTRVTITIEIQSTARWSDLCTVGQVKKQAVDDAVTRLNYLFQDSDLAKGMKLLPKTTVDIVTIKGV